jgi:hypothetical protein
VTRIVDQTTVQTEYAPTSRREGAPRAYRLGWYNYYKLGYADLATPRYGHETQLLYFETNMYRLSDGRLVWSALSPGWLGQLPVPGMGVDHLARQIASALRQSRTVARRQ